MLKQLFAYIIWIIVSLLLGIGHMRIILGPKKKSSKGFLQMFDFVHDLVLFQVGLIIGGIIALLFIVFDFFYLKKRFKNHKSVLLIRFLFLLAIAIIVGLTHYMLEKVVDII